MKPYTILGFVIVSGCSMDAKLIDPPAVLECADFRDNETFSIAREDIHSIRVNPLTGESVVSFTDSTGRTRVLPGNVDYIKCGPPPGN